MNDPTPTPPEVEVSARAREALLGFVSADPKARHVRIHVGRGWGGWSFHLSLEETADPQRDVVFESGGVSFVAEHHQRHLLPGLRIEIHEVFGREGLVAWNASLEPGGC